MQVLIGDQKYNCAIESRDRDINWKYRNSKSITIEMDYATAVATFIDDAPWSTIYQGPDYYDPEKQQMVTPEPVETDCSDYCILGDITVHRDGTVTVKMGKPTGEELYNILREAVEGEQEAAN